MAGPLGETVTPGGTVAGAVGDIGVVVGEAVAGITAVGKITAVGDGLMVLVGDEAAEDIITGGGFGVGVEAVS